MPLIQESISAVTYSSQFTLNVPAISPSYTSQYFILKRSNMVKCVCYFLCHPLHWSTFHALACSSSEKVELVLEVASVLLIFCFLNQVKELAKFQFHGRSLESLLPIIIITALTSAHQLFHYMLGKATSQPIPPPPVLLV